MVKLQYICTKLLLLPYFPMYKKKDYFYSLKFQNCTFNRSFVNLCLINFIYKTKKKKNIL